MLRRLRFLCLCLLIAPTWAQPAPRLDRAEVEAWADATFTRGFSERRFSGLVIAVVQDDALLFARGYGYADFPRKTPVDPVNTRFRIGSITKTFTAIAIAQLLQRGVIHSLDDPVNRYLVRDRLPTIAGHDITLRQLLTHTAGFGSQAFNLATDETFALPLSAPQVRRQRMPIVRPPGERSVYSNYGTALLAVVVEDLTGQTIEQYFKEHIFAPLQMDDSVLNTTLRPSPGTGVPYRFFPSGVAQAQPFFGVHPFFAPVGAIESTAADMARYMIANLQEGRGESATLLAPETFRELHRRMAGNHPLSSGFGMVFVTLDWNNTEFFGHGGDWPGFHSIMLMSRQNNVGFFISCMCEFPQPGFIESVIGSERMRASPSQPVLDPMTNIGITSAFLERFWGKRAVPQLSGQADVGRFVGTYWHEFRNYHSAEKFIELLGGESSTLRVERDSGNGLRINGRGGYHARAPGVFWNPAAEPDMSGNFWNSGLWAFTLDSTGAPQYASPTFAIEPYLRAGSFNNPRFAVHVLLVCALFAFTGVCAAFWPGGVGFGRFARWLPLAVIGSLLGSVLLLMANYREGEGFASELLLGQRARLIGLVSVADLMAVVMLTMWIAAVHAWRHGYWSGARRAQARRIHFLLLTIAATGCVWVCGFANLLGAKLP